jgi:AraC-like DNA-binding protein
LPNTQRLREFPVVATTSVDAAHDALVNVCGARDFDRRPSEDNFRAVGNHARFKHLDLSYTSYTAPVRLTFPATVLVRQQFALAGKGQTTFGRSNFTIDVNKSCVIPAGVEFLTEFESGYSQLRLAIDSKAMETKLAALIGRPLSQEIEFLSPSTIDAKQSHLRHSIEFFVGLIDRDYQHLSELMIAELEQLVIVSFLTANPHNYSASLDQRAPSASPWQVRAAEEYIEANWRRPIHVEDIAQATGASARSIFQTFKAAHGCTPMEYVKSVRLKQARRLLQESDISTSVTGVALLCGFNNVGHFAHHYRDAFGELPSKTLLTAKRPRPFRDMTCPRDAWVQAPS